jgi:hypothetical protein
MSNANDMAFPVVLATTRTPNDSEQLGLTKREYFAAMAMQGLCANSIPGSHHSFNNTANEAVRYADALLAELAK